MAMPSGGFAIQEGGNVYGRLRVLRRDPVRREKEGTPGKNAFWICKCACGTEVTVRGRQLRSGLAQSCGCLRRERLKERNSLPFGVSAKNRAVAVMKANARNRDIPWNLTDEQVLWLSQQPCNYCGDQPKQTSKGRNGNFVYNGLDRVDNAASYELANIVPCCIICNNAKRALSVAEFFDWVKRLAAHSIQKGRI